MECPSCGRKLPDNAMVCPYCESVLNIDTLRACDGRTPSEGMPKATSEMEIDHEPYTFDDEDGLAEDDRMR